MKQRRLITAVTTMIIILSFASMNIEISFSDGTDAKVDIFTQKEPFNGKGPNVPSDAFGPGEIVILYAMVEYNGQPLQNYLVTFHIQSSNGSSFTFTSATNTTGIASISFRLPQKYPPYQNETFGEWTATADVYIGDHIFQDTLTFKVDWIIELISVRTIDENLVTRNYFGKNGDVGLEITLRNIAMTEKNVTLAIVLLDDLEVPIDFLEIDNFEAQPNGKTLFLYCKMIIPRWAFIGKGKVLVSALTALPSQNGVAYCPSISTEFFITISEPLKVKFHDVAIFKVSPSTSSAKIGELVYINVKVRNEGTELESFDVNVYINSQIIGTSSILNLAPYSSKTLSFILNTSDISFGNYLVSATISQVLDEADTTDNTIINGYIEIKPAKKRFLAAFEQTGLSADAYGTVLIINGSTLTIDKLPCKFWIEEGSVITYSYEETVLSTIAGKRFKLNIITGLSSPLTVTGNITVVGNYKTQYYLQVSSLYGKPTPESGWFDAETSITASVISPWFGPKDTRYICTGWIGTGSIPTFGTGQTITFTITQPSSIMWNWKTQYLLTVTTDPAGLTPQPTGSPAGEPDSTGCLWYDENANVSLFAPPIRGYDFIYWDVDGVSKPADMYQITVYMDKPHTATAHYSMFKAAYIEWLYLVLLTILIFLTILLSILAYRRIKRKKTEKEAFHRGWTAWYYGYNLRGKT
jgi:hypothetical protein